MSGIRRNEFSERDLIDLGSSEFIEGIYNYCDRWCERCHMTEHCRVFADESPDQTVNDLENEEFWNEIEANLSRIREWLEQMAEERGIEWDEEELEAIQQRQKEQMAEARDHPLSVHSREYMEEAGQWLESHEQVMRDKPEQWQEQYEMNVNRDEAVKKFEKLEDVLEVIHWYRPQIHVKLTRALKSQLSEFPEDEDRKDSDGSAKIALIGIDRSIAAWRWLYEQLPEQEDSILDLLVDLEKLRNQTEDSFPNARSFQRPGFDDRYKV